MLSTSSRILLAMSLSFMPAMLQAQATDASIVDQLKHLRAVPTDQRPAATMKIALDISHTAGRPA